jgi:hypothetical protein
MPEIDRSGAEARGRLISKDAMAFVGRGVRSIATFGCVPQKVVLRNNAVG